MRSFWCEAKPHDHSSCSWRTSITLAASQSTRSAIVASLSPVQRLATAFIRIDQDVAGLTHNGHLCPILIGGDDPLHVESGDEEVADDGADAVDEGVRVRTVVVGKREPGLLLLREKL